jgi:hypothetical protein
LELHAICGQNSQFSLLECHAICGLSHCDWWNCTPFAVKTHNFHCWNATQFAVYRIAQSELCFVFKVLEPRKYDFLIGGIAPHLRSKLTIFIAGMPRNLRSIAL